MRNGWKPKKLNELGYVGRGRSRHRPRNDAKLYGGTYPFIQTAEIMASQLYITKYSKTYNEVGLSQSKLWKKNTLCMTIAGENTAETAILAFEACFPDSIVGFIPYPDKADVRFVKYYLDTIKSQFKSISRGATQDNLSLDKLLSFNIFTPSLLTQHKIATILSAYDDLIENNTRRIAILEEMAQSIYQEWFVKFRYPGHEKDEMVESELGMIPVGWTLAEIGQIATVYRGRSYGHTNLVKDGGLPFLNLKCIERDGGFRYDGIKQYQGPYKETHTTHTGDIIMAVTDVTQERRLIARAARVPRSEQSASIFSMDLVKIAPNDERYREYLYSMLRFSNFSAEVKQHANGANVLHLSPTRIEKFVFPFPPVSLCILFSKISKSIYEASDILQLKNANLRHTRDLLLPKLISGEIDVEALDIKVPEIIEPEQQDAIPIMTCPETMDATQLALPLM